MNINSLQNFSENYKQGVKSYLSRDLKALKKNLARCSDSSEKKLLFLRQSILEQKLDLALSTAETLSDYFPHVKAEKHLQLASIYSIRSQHEKAIAENLKSLEYFRSTKDRNRVYAILYNLSVDCSLLRMRDLSNDFLDQAESLATTPDEFLEIARAKACNYSQEAHFEKALEVLSKIKRELNQAPRLEAATFCMVAADICVRAGEFDLASKYLARVSMKKNYSYYERAHIQKKQLDFLMGGKKTLSPKKLFTAHKGNEYLLQWNLLVHVQNGERSEALKIWQELCQCRPRTYGSFLNSVDKSDSLALFFRCIKKLLLTENVLYPENLELSGKLKSAYDLFISSRTPLRKEELIEKLWDVPYSSEFDDRFYKLMERLKSKIPHKVIQKNRAYLLSS